MGNTQRELYQQARDALVAAGRNPPGEDVYWSLGSLRQVVAALDTALDGVAKALVEQARAGELTAVEGPFEGEALEAAETASRWIERGRLGLRAAASVALDNAHVAIAGCASRPPV